VRTAMSTRRALVAVTIAVVALVGLGGPALAGGWAVTTMDPLAASPRAGVPVPVGFTIRQHGVTPVNLDDVALEVIAADGAVHRFAAKPDGAKGHYVATVEFQSAGTFHWRVLQGWFAPQDLGTIEVGSGGGSSALGGSSSPPWPVLMLTGIAATVFVVALV